MSTGGTDPVELTADTALKEGGGPPSPAGHQEPDLPPHDDETIVVVLDEAQAVQDLPHAQPETTPASAEAPPVPAAASPAPSAAPAAASTVTQAPATPPTVRTAAVARTQATGRRLTVTARPSSTKAKPAKRTPKPAPTPAPRRGRRPAPTVIVASPALQRAQAVAILQAQLAAAETVLNDQIAVRLHQLQGEQRAAAMAVLTHLSTT